MKENFESILTTLLEKRESSDNKDINSILDELELSPEGKEKLRETNEIIDLFTQKATSLEEAKCEGKTRKRWMMDQIDVITENCTEEEKATVVTAISNATEQAIEFGLNDNTKE